MPSSFHAYLSVPSAVISDGIVAVPLWAVTSMQLSQTYQLPAIGSTTARAVVAVHDDTITLTGALLGPERFAWKLALEQLAETSRRGSALGAFTSGRVGGLILVTSMTIRTDLQVKTLSFTASAAKREVLDVSIVLAHMPLPGSLAKLLDVGSLGVAALADWAAG
jgi:phage protein U